MYPVFSKLSANSQPALKMAVEKCMNFLLICAIPIAALLIVAAPNIVGFIYHRAEFANTIPVLQTLAPGLVFLYINTLFGTVIVSTKGEKKIPISAAIALAFNLGLNLFLIPIYRQVGAALVTSLTELLLLCISIFFVPKFLLPGRSLIVGGKALVAALVMTMAVYLLKVFSILLILPVALLVYASMAFLLRMVPREDMQRLYRAIRYKGVETSTEPLASVIDENIFARATERLPAVTMTEDRPKLRKIQLEEVKE
jgi:O-antigen/teichoic acid export membrane protein